MALFSEEKQQKWKNEMNHGLAQLGGMGIGTGAGYLAQKSLDAKYQNKKEESRKHWDIMLKLYNGTLTMNEIPIEDRIFYQKMLKENQDDLKYLSHNPLAAKASFTSNFAEKAHHPKSKILPPLLGLAGSYGAGKAYKLFQEKSKSE